MQVAAHCEMSSRIYSRSVFVVLLLLGFIQPLHKGLQITLEHLTALRTPEKEALHKEVGAVSRICS